MRMQGEKKRWTERGVGIRLRMRCSRASGKQGSAIALSKLDRIIRVSLKHSSKGRESDQAKSLKRGNCMGCY